jgi:hypothetical protein
MVHLVVSSSGLAIVSIITEYSGSIHRVPCVYKSSGL